MTYLKIYRALIYMLWPFVGFYLVLRKKKGKEDLVRFGERLGFASHERPAGKLIWIHAASVGESISMLPLIDALLEKYKNTSIVMTTGSVTSAALMEKRLPKKAFHQYVPLDNPVCVGRFLNFYKPQAAVFCESEFWPNLMYETYIRKIPLMLVNGRVSDKTFKKKDKSAKLFKPLLSMFTVVLGQTDEDARRLREMGAKNAKSVGNLKMAGAEVPVDEVLYKEMEESIKGRIPVLAASTHKGEEEILIKTYRKLKKKEPKLLLIILPRHPSRGQEIADLTAKEKLTGIRRSKGETIDRKTDIYIADKLGEVGVFFKLCASVFMGGSLVPTGGHNLLEPAKFACYIATGPNMQNFREMFALAQEFKCVAEVKGENDLADFFTKTMKKGHANKSALKFVDASAKVLEEVMGQLSGKLDRVLKGKVR